MEPPPGRRLTVEAGRQRHPFGMMGASRHPPQRVGIFANEASIRTLVGAILMQQTEEWTVQRGRYLALETLASVCDDVMACPAPSATDQLRPHHSARPNASYTISWDITLGIGLAACQKRLSFGLTTAVADFCTAVDTGAAADAGSIFKLSGKRVNRNT